MKWNEFKEAVADELPTTTKWSLSNGNKKGRMLFRGQEDESWSLKTTLERANGREKDLLSYARTCLSAKRYMGSILSKDFGLEQSEKTIDCKPFEKFPNLELSVYLRHHGFPSPLLDWTESPFVAAYFALAANPNSSSDAAIFGYRPFEEVTLGESGRYYSQLDSDIWTVGPWIETHERHVAQLCQYTCCISTDEDNCEFSSHQEIFSKFLQEETPQKNHFKWVIDSSERHTAIADLFNMNITPYSLFRTQDAAAKTAAMKLFGEHV
ncbi:MAG: FRG domain-containing protein [Verrucomicrobiaceae bacterium]